MCHAVCRAVVCEAVEAVGCLRGLLLLQCAAKICGQCAERVAVPYEGVAFHRVHVDRYGVVARCHAVGRGYLKPYGTGEVDGVVGVCEVVVDGFFAFLACFDEVSHRHSLEHAYAGHKLVGACSVRERVAVENQPFVEVYREKNGVEVFKHAVVFAEGERVDGHARCRILGGNVRIGVTSHKNKGRHKGRQAYCSEFLH